MNRTKKLIGTCLIFALALASSPLLAATAGVVNINTASAEQLELLPRVGPSIAVRIIEYRQNDKFKSAEDLLLVRGIGERTFRLIEPYVTVSGQSTLTEKVKASEAAAESGDAYL